MVFTTFSLFIKARHFKRKFLKEGFRDSLKLFVKAGCGGNGLPKFGGVGGQGGSIVAVAKENISLEEVYKYNRRKHWFAQDGRNSTHNFIIGTPGEKLIMEVPVGVSIYNDMGKKIGELNKEGEELVIAKGGTGGNPKNGFLGTKGQSYPIRLDLKLIADIGLVGFPNAGKSTLLKAISNARPRIASYPFTTIRPNLGIISFKDFRQMSLADLPGLIEGAHANKGMGHEFLKHVERTKLLLLIADINGFQLSPYYPMRSCLDTVILLNKELELYNPELLKKPSILLINKMDTEGADEKYMAIREQLKNLQDVLPSYPDVMRPETALEFSSILPISAKEDEDDIRFVKDRLRALLDTYDELSKQEELLSENVYEESRKNLKERGPSLV